ncbi:MAG: hypothetical protein KAU31_02745, partial [Spirochaetaceae bacterium]|nr:hypothetical protein [Spirochaetaceae bacterium]
LLISVVAFSGFAVLAWSGLFDYIETTFYLDRVQSSIQLRVERISGQVEGFHRANLDRFSAVLNQGSVRRAFEVNQAREDIVERANYFDALQSRLPSLDYVRFLDLGGNRLHFSTREDDFSEDGTSRIYTPLSILDVGESYPIGDLAYDDVVDSENAHQLVGEGVPTPDIILSPINNQFVYRFPVLDEFGLLQGTGLFYVHAGGLSTWLVRDGLVGAGDEIDLILTAEQEGPAGGVLVNSRGQWSVTLESGIAANWPAVLLGERPVLSTDDSTAFTLFSSDPEAVSLSPYIVLYLFPEDDLQMTDIMKIVLLAATFLTVFLLVFLLFNFRQDAVVVLSDRVKRFQISLLREYMENKQDLDFQRWRAELEDRRGEVATQIRRGIGRVRASQKEEVDKLIDSSWDEILEVLGSRAGQAPERGVDLERLEDIVERVIGNLQSVDSRMALPRTAQPLPPSTEDTAADGGAVEGELGEPIEVEE